ncbi:MAG: hypothetical protein J2P24_14255 [Streptosporangiales bacterium]|nr:hypothetical protein [Streptosporangiales bacterium]
MPSAGSTSRSRARTCSPRRSPRTAEGTSIRVESQVTSVSWIPSEAVTGNSPISRAFTTFSHYDDPPPAIVGDLERLRSTDRFRFANRLTAWADFDGDRVVGHGMDGGCVMGSSRVRVGPLGTTFAAIPLPDLRSEPIVGSGWVRFGQTVGGRAAMPCPRRVSRPPFVRVHSPLVWTTPALTLRADGRVEASLDGASPFPRHWVYGADDRLTLKAGTTDFEAWLGQEGRSARPGATRTRPWWSRPRRPPWSGTCRRGSCAAGGRR